MEPDDAKTTDPRLPETPRKREAEEWALVLQAEGVPVAVVRREPARTDASQGEVGSFASHETAWKGEPAETSRGARTPVPHDWPWTVAVPPADVELAASSLAAWRAERALPPPAEEPALVFTLPSPIEVALALASAAALVAFHLGLERSGRLTNLIDRGENQAALVLTGELHRCLTALTLHADVAHAAGNALFGTVFLAALAARLGPGLALGCFFATGAVGNLADVLYHRAAYSTVGASTGVFGLVGVLTGLAAWRRHQRSARGRGAWVALGAGLALVAMLGGAGPKVALAAHLFGLGAGALAGIGLAYPLAQRPRPGTAAQLAAALASAGAIALAWQRALA